MITTLKFHEAHVNADEGLTIEHADGESVELLDVLRVGPDIRYTYAVISTTKRKPNTSKESNVNREKA